MREGNMNKGGLNNPPTGHRPPAPIGQGSIKPPQGGSDVPPKREGLQITVKIEMDDVLHKILNLPEYGEVRIITHAGKVTFVETTVKEKVE